VNKIGVMQEFEDYAKDWIAYSDKRQKLNP
jgi:hypothetical protein